MTILTRPLLRVAAMIALSLASMPASAAFHLWEITEVFSNADGSVQFIELFNESPGEQFLAGHSIRSNSNTFNFLQNLPLQQQTVDRHFLIATPDFAALPGAVTPDFTFPSGNFFNPAGDTINFASVSIRTLQSMPIDGIDSRHFTTSGVPSTAVNSPTNFADATGQIDLSTPAPTGDYNGNGVVDAADYTVWRDTLGQDVSPGSGADGDADGMINAGDYDFWKARFGDTVAGAGSAGALPSPAAVPEPATACLLAMCLVTIGIGRRR